MITQKITLERPERFSAPHEISREKLVRAAELATDKLEAFARKHGAEAFPPTCSQNFKYPVDINKHWECGMYTGCYWLAYEITGNKFFKETAEAQLPTYKRRIDEKIGMDDHDVGFVFSPSCVAAYRLTGNEAAREYALEAAKYYYPTSYSKKGKFIIRSHRSWDAGTGCRTMMDSLMNAPLLFWASKELGCEEYWQAACDHVKTTEQLLIRADGSSYHHYQFDPATAAPVKGLTFQGHADESCWSRGHAWGVYGFPIAYSYNGEEYLKETHKGVTYFMLNRLPEDLVPHWDYDFAGTNAYRDTSAGVISVCGMHEMAGMLSESDEQKAVYESAAAQILESVIDNYTGDIGKEHDGLIHHVTHAVPFKVGLDECAIYGDYFYLEALARYLKPDFKKYW